MEMWTAVTEQSKCVTYVNERCVTYVSGLNTCPYKINGYIPKRTAWIYVTYEIASLRSQRHYFQELLLQEKGVIRESPVRRGGVWQEGNSPHRERGHERRARTLTKDIQPNDR